MAARGRFITFEGGDGVGKSTQAAHLAHALENHGIETVRTFEPGGTPFGGRVREMFLDEEIGALDARTQALLLNAARREHLVTVIRPALESGNWVVCDRFSDSTLAYQGILEGAGVEWVKELDRLATGSLKPDLTFLLKLDPDSAAERLSARSRTSGDRAGEAMDRYDRQDATTHKRLDSAFEEVAKMTPERFVVLDGNEPETVLADRIWAAVETRFGPLTDSKGA